VLESGDLYNNSSPCCPLGELWGRKQQQHSKMAGLNKGSAGAGGIVQKQQLDNLGKMKERDSTKEHHLPCCFLCQPPHQPKSV
jgi:hypothetical protein